MTAAVPAGDPGATCDGFGWCVKHDAAPAGVLACNGAGRCMKGYASAPTLDPGALLDRLEREHVPVEWQECGEDGIPDLDKPLPPFCRACAAEEYVDAVEFGDTIDQGDPVISWPCDVVVLLRLARDGLALRAGVERLAEEMETVADEVTPDAERHTRTNSSNRRQRGYAAALRHAADRLRAVVADTSGERQ